MDRAELETIQKLHDEFREAIDGTAGKKLPEDEEAKPLVINNAHRKGFGANKSLK